MKELIEHILAMKDDAYLTGHPEWEEIVKEAELLKLKEAPFAIIGDNAKVQFNDKPNEKNS